MIYEPALRQGDEQNLLFSSVTEMRNTGNGGNKYFIVSSFA